MEHYTGYLECARTSTVPIMLEALAYHSDPYVRAQVASRPLVRISVLRKLARDPVPFVRGCVVSHRCTPRDAVEYVAQEPFMEGDKAWFLRAALAENYMTPKDVLWALFKIGEWSIYRGIVCNPLPPPELLDAVADLPVDPEPPNKMAPGGWDRNREVRKAALQRLAQEDWSWSGYAPKKREKFQPA